MSRYYSELEFDREAYGWIDLSERGEREEDGVYSSVTLLYQQADIALHLRWTDQDIDGNDYGRCGIDVSLSVVHASNKETDRTFHSHLSHFMTRDEAVVMHDWLGFMLGNWER